MSRARDGTPCRTSRRRGPGHARHRSHDLDQRRRSADTPSPVALSLLRLPRGAGSPAGVAAHVMMAVRPLVAAWIATLLLRVLAADELDRKTRPRVVRSPPCRTFPPVSPSADHRSLQREREPGRSLDGFGTPPSRSGVETTVDPFHVLPESPAHHRRQRRRDPRRPRCLSGARLTGPRPGEGASLAAVLGGPIPLSKGGPPSPAPSGQSSRAGSRSCAALPLPVAGAWSWGGVTGMASALFVLGPPTVGPFPSPTRSGVPRSPSESEYPSTLLPSDPVAHAIEPSGFA